MRSSRHARRAAASARLNTVETRYLEDLVPYLRSVPKRPRRQIIDEFVDVLSSRPASESSSELVGALGQPRAVAARLRREADFDGPTPLWRRWWLQPSVTKLLQAFVLGVMLVAALVLRGYYTARPEFGNNCSAIVATEFEDFHAAGVSERRVNHRPGERFGVMLCPSTPASGVIIERIFVPETPTTFRYVGWEVSHGGARATYTGNAADHQAWTPDDFPDGNIAKVIMWFEMDGCMQSYRTGFDAATIGYRYRGRSHEAEVSLGTHLVSISGEAQPCDEEAVAGIREEDQAFRDALSARVGSLDSLTEFRLSDLAVGSDLCRYLDGVEPALDLDGEPQYDDFESLEERAVFQIGDPAISTAVIEAALIGLCPEFADQRDDLVGLLSRSG